MLSRLSSMINPKRKLGCEAIAAGLGIFYVFKDEELRQQFLANRYRNSGSKNIGMCWSRSW